jgi:hypothetical protein
LPPPLPSAGWAQTLVGPRSRRVRERRPIGHQRSAPGPPHPRARLLGPPPKLGPPPGSGASEAVAWARLGEARPAAPPVGSAQPDRRTPPVGSAQPDRRPVERRHVRRGPCRSCVRRARPGVALGHRSRLRAGSDETSRRLVPRWAGRREADERRRRPQVGGRSLDATIEPSRPAGTTGRHVSPRNSPRARMQAITSFGNR